MPRKSLLLAQMAPKDQPNLHFDKPTSSFLVAFQGAAQRQISESGSMCTAGDRPLDSRVHRSGTSLRLRWKFSKSPRDSGRKRTIRKSSSVIHVAAYGSGTDTPDIKPKARGGPGLCAVRRSNHGHVLYRRYVPATPRIGWVNEPLTSSLERSWPPETTFNVFTVRFSCQRNCL